MAQFQVYEDSQGEYRWRLLADNNQVIATSGEGYKQRADCERGIELVKEHAAEAEVRERA